MYSRSVLSDLPASLRYSGFCHRILAPFLYETASALFMKHIACFTLTPLSAIYWFSRSDNSDVAFVPGDNSGAAHRGAPRRKTGWWQFADTERHSEQWLCIFDATESRFSSFDQITQKLLIGTKCSKAEFQRVGSGYSFETACDTGISASEGGGIVTSKGTMTGDLHVNYVIQMPVTQAGRARQGKIVAQWKAACPANRKEDDLLVAPDTVVNVLHD